MGGAMAKPLFYRTIYDADALEECFGELFHAPLAEQDRIEVGCLIQYFMILRTHGILALPVDIAKHAQGEGPDFTLCSSEGLFGVEMTKVTTRDYQLWRKRRVNYRAIRDVNDYLHCKPEHRVSELAAMRVLRKNFKIASYFAAISDMESCDLVLEEDGDCSMNIEVLMALLQSKLAGVKPQKFRRISMISGSVLYYAINTCDAEVLHAPTSTPMWLKPQKPMLYDPATASLH
jgi:hypothetical protein